MTLLTHSDFCATLCSQISSVLADCFFVSSNRSSSFTISVCGEGLHLIRIILDLVVFKKLNITNHRFLTPQVPIHASRHQTINSSSSLLSYMTILDGFVLLQRTNVFCYISRMTTTVIFINSLGAIIALLCQISYCFKLKILHM